MLVQEIVRNHERPVLLHLRRRHLQQPSTTISELGAGRPGAQQGECQGQEGYQECVIVCHRLQRSQVLTKLLHGGRIQKTGVIGHRRLPRRISGDLHGF